MQKENLDALLITNDENFLCFIGLPDAFGMHRSNGGPGVEFAIGKCDYDWCRQAGCVIATHWNVSCFILPLGLNFKATCLSLETILTLLNSISVKRN